MIFGNRVIAICIDGHFGENHEELFRLLGYSDLVHRESYSLKEIVIHELVTGDKFESGLLLGKVGKGTLIFDFELFVRDDLLNKILVNKKAFCFHLSASENKFWIKYYDNGQLVRDNFSDERFQEIGHPLPFEASNDPNQIIIEGLIDICGREAQLSECRFDVFTRKKSFLYELFS